MKPSYHHGNLKLALLRAVEKIVNADGVGAVTMRSVAGVTGVTHTAPQHHYGNKAGLLTAFATEGFHALDKALDAAYKSAPDAHPLLRFKAVGDAYLRFAEQHPAHFQVMFQPSLFNSDDEDYATASTATYKVLSDAAGKVAEAGVVPNEHTEALAVRAWGTVHGLAMLWQQGSFDTRAVSFPSLAGVGEMTLPLLGALLAGPTRP